MFATPKLNIIHVDTAGEWRGGQQQLFYLAIGMHVRGHQVKVACPKDSPLGVKLQEQNIPIVPIPEGWSIEGVIRLAGCKTDLLAAHTSHAHGMCAFLNTSFVVHRRVDFIPRSKWKYRRPKAYICVSDAVKKIIMTHVPDASCFRVYDGVPSFDVSGEEPLPEKSVLCIGARVPHKGHEILSKAAALIPEIDIWVAGEGPLQFPHLNYLGYRPDIAKLMRSARLIVHPSIEEGLGQVVIEAMMMGASMVVSDAGGVPEAVGDTAVIVPAGDPKALAEAIRLNLQGPKVINFKAMERARNLFTVDAMVENSIAAYSSVLQCSNSVE